LIKETNRERKNEDDLELGETQFTDWTEEEIKAFLNLKHPVPKVRNLLESYGTRPTLPESRGLQSTPPSVWNWATVADHNTPMKNQGSCGSCWSFAGVASLETQIKIKNSSWTIQPLSTQELVDCTYRGVYGLWGCDGGIMEPVFKYLFDKQGIASEAAYPYRGVRGTCRTGLTRYGNMSTTNTLGYKTVRNTTAAMKAAIHRGPIPVYIFASKEFMLYKSGIWTKRTN
jgi:C1A family cysteine protease